MVGSKELYDIFEIIYPVGIIIELDNDSNPKDLFGIGEWEQIKDCFLLACGDSYEAGNSGGEANITLTTANMPKHCHKPLTEKISSTDTYPNYMFSINRDLSSTSTARFTVAKGSDYYVIGVNSAAADFVSVDDVTQTTSTSYVGEGESFTNLPPYYVCYRWKRIG